MNKPILVPAFLIACRALLPAHCLGQTLFGVGLTASTLGVGVQAGVSVTKLSNIRVGVNAFNYTDNFTKDGIDYSATLKLRSAQLTYDNYFRGLGGFHISPGMLLYDGNKAGGSANIPGGQSFSLGGTTYYSAGANPVTGTGSVTVLKAAPMILLGFGNLLPRGRHFGVNFEVGAVFEGTPKAVLNLGGTTCLNSQQTSCVSTATDPGVQANLQAEQTKLNNSLNLFKFYPVVSLGFSFRF